MKRLIALTLAVLLFASQANAASVTATTSTSVTVGQVFSIEFYTEAGKIRYGSGQIQFPAYDPASDTTMILTSAWANNDGQSDVGVVCRSNIGQNWALKIRMSSATMLPTNVAVYKPDKVYNRNYSGVASERSTGLTKQWYIMSSSDETIYTGSGGDQNSAPLGILATFSFAILPTGKATPTGQTQIGSGNILASGTHNLDVIYTLTTTL